MEEKVIHRLHEDERICGALGGIWNEKAMFLETKMEDVNISEWPYNEGF